ncbi:hypothetical protein AX14_009009 [Amanita brunnescens Koide BX004]|nr:hypothetical protein AX14_009009 [Amanita brunnescens Koide BX004]
MQNMLRKYHDWAQKNDFESKLSIDVKAHKQQKATENDSQSTLDAHLHEWPPPAKVIKYSDAAFMQAVLEWLVTTNQPLDATNHPKFKEMIDIAVHAENGVCIPTIKATCQGIINLFNKNLIALKKRLNVSLSCSFET